MNPARAPLRIVYVNQDFPPEVGAGPARILEMSRHWRRAGAQVTVVTGMPNRRMAGLSDGAIHPDYRGRLLLEESWEGIRVLRSWVYSSPNRSFARTLLNNASFTATSIAHALARVGPSDVVIASSPPLLAHVTGDALRRKLRVPLVLELRDLWPDYMVEMGVLKSPAAQRLLFGLEHWLLRCAARAVVVTEPFRRRIAAKGFPADAIDVISNGADLRAYYRDPEPDTPLPELRRSAGEFLVGYLGNFGAGQELRTVVRAAARLESAAPDVRFVLVGDGKEKERVRACAAELGVRNLSMHPPLEKERTRAFYNCCDLCLVPLAPVPIFNETVPSKIFEVMACERPLVAGVAGEAARIVRESGGGEVTPPGDDAALAAAVERMRALAPEQRAAMGRRGRDYVARHYSREAMAARYLDMLQRLTRGSMADAPVAGRARRVALR